MAVRIIKPLAGPRQAWGAGDLYDCDDVVGARLIAAGIAAPVAPPAADVAPPEPPEAAVVEPAERAIRPRARGRGRG